MTTSKFWEAADVLAANIAEADGYREDRGSRKKRKY